MLESVESYTAAVKVCQLLKDEIMPAATRAVQNSEKVYVVGEISYLEFLEFKRQLLDARLRLTEAEADVRRSIAQLCYSVGGKILSL